MIVDTSDSARKIVVQRATGNNIKGPAAAQRCMLPCREAMDNVE